MHKIFKGILLLIIAISTPFSKVKSQVKLLTLNELETRLTKGKDTTYVINFWATWCVPCVEELPYFEAVNNEKQGKPFKMLLLSLDFKSKLNTTVIPFVKKNNIKAEVFLLNELDQQKMIDRVDKDWSGSIPATLIINNKHKVRSFYEKSFTKETLEKAIIKATNL